MVRIFDGLRRVRRFAAAGLVASTLFVANSATAADGDNKSLDWLMREPVTLLDLGIFRLKADLVRVSRQLHEQGFTALPPQSGVYYDWREKSVIAYISVRETMAQPNQHGCRRIFERMTRQLVGNGPVGNRQASWYLENIFAPEGPGNAFRPKTMARDLLAGVRFEVSVLPPDPLRNATKAQCSGRLDADMKDLKHTMS